MHHVYPISKGDQLCPLGFHPQVRWPTRCKRCFRDYKEHGSKRGEDVAASSPSLSTDSSNSRTRNGSSLDRPIERSWTSTSNLTSINTNNDNNARDVPKRPSSWTSTPDLDESNKTDVVVNIALPKRRHTILLENPDIEESFTLRRPPLPPMSKEAPEDLTILRTDSLAERARKMQLLKRQSSLERDGSRERSQSRTVEPEKPPPLPEPRQPIKKERKEKPMLPKPPSDETPKPPKAVQFKENLIDEKPPIPYSPTIDKKTNSSSVEHHKELDVLRKELETTKARAERAERDKSDILLRRLANLDVPSNKTAASEALKLQQKVNELTQQLEDTQKDRKTLANKVKDLEKDLNVRPTKNAEEDIRKKLQAAETLCEELMDENEDMKKELRNMEQEIDEMQDNFREEQVDEYSTIKKELEQTTKNCRILSFKYKKSERKIEQLEMEKQALGNQMTNELATKVKKLEEELRIANEVARQLQSEVNSNTLKVPGKSKAPSLGTIGKSTSADGRITRGSLTRGGSQEDPVQLLRDLQDSMERETDIREQLKYAEEEAESARKKAQRVEDENESLMMQLKKMAGKARNRKPSPSRLNVDVPIEKDEGISDEEDPAELRVLLELNEQESSQLRRKVEEIENNYEASKKQIKDLQEKLKQSTSKQGTIKGKLPTFLSKTLAGDKESERKLGELEREVTELKRKITEKEKSFKDMESAKQLLEASSKEKLLTEQRNSAKKLETLEKDANDLRTKMQVLELDNEKISNENKKLALHAARLARKDSNSTADKDKAAELIRLKESFSKLEKEKLDLDQKLKIVLEVPADKIPPRVPKKFTDASTKLQLQKMISDQEDEIKEMRAIILRTGADKVAKLEDDKAKLTSDLNSFKDQLTKVNTELRLLQNKKTSEAQSQIKELEDKISKQNSAIKQLETSKVLLEKQIKQDQEKQSKLEIDLDKEKKERKLCETKIEDLDGDLATHKKNADKVKSVLEKEIFTLRTKAATITETVTSKKVQELRKQTDDLQIELDRDKKRYSDFTAKYEQLEEEHVLIKAQLITEKENLQTELTQLKSKLTQLESECLASKKDKLDLNRKLNDAEGRVRENDRKISKMNAFELENTGLKSALDEKNHKFNKLTMENDMNKDVCNQMKREIEELKKKLGDFEKVNKVQGSMMEHSTNLEHEIKRLTHKMESTEIATKSEVAATRLRYEQQARNLQAEMSALQRQSEKFKRDRDTFKQLLEASQKTIAELKNNSGGRISRASLTSGDEDDKSKIIILEQQVGSLEDELCEARLEVSKLKTELVSEKSVFEIKVSELQSRMNEYEEDRLINSGRTKTAGLKTKLELSWQKEREDQQRILQETSTLARDLRQTLFEVERERDKERLETKRKLNLLKKANDEELDEGRKKISELQCDLLELRDAHAKLRTTNEKLRRERERYDRERENTVRKRIEQDGEQRIGILLQTVDEFIKIGPEMLSISKSVPPNNTSNSNATHLHPNPPSRNRSRSPSPARNTAQISALLSRLTDASEDLRKYQRICRDEKERDKLMRRGSGRRAASTETDTPEMARHSSSRIARSSSTHNGGGNLYRKSISFDQSIQQQQTLWKRDDGSISSMQSIDSVDMGRQSSMDSRLSGGSTQSDMPRGARKKKRGIMGKLRSLTKSMGPESEGSVQGSDSDVSISSDYKSSKTNLKGRLSGLFKRAASVSRAGSEERSLGDSTHRPISLNISNGQSQSQLPPPTTPRLNRASSRPPTPSGTTPAMKRKPQPSQ